jgi:hypothetical protein
LFVVGGFHVAKHLHTVARYAARRPDDRARVLLMVDGDPAAGPTAKDLGEGDLLVVAPAG